MRTTKHMPHNEVYWDKLRKEFAGLATDADRESKGAYSRSLDTRKSKPLDCK